MLQEVKHGKREEVHKAVREVARERDCLKAEVQPY